MALIKAMGGDGFDCPTQPQSFYIAEEIESKILWNIETVYKLEEGEELNSNLRIQKLSSIYPQLTLMIAKDLDWVKTNLKIIPDIHLVNLDDDLIAWTPADCSLVQVAVQTLTDVIVVKSFWDKMNPIQRELLLTHEAVYKSLDRLSNMQNVDLQNSVGIRLLNAFIWQKDGSRYYTPMSDEELRQAIIKTQLRDIKLD